MESTGQHRVSKTRKALQHATNKYFMERLIDVSLPEYIQFNILHISYHTSHVRSPTTSTRQQNFKPNQFPLPLFTRFRLRRTRRKRYTGPEATMILRLSQQQQLMQSCFGSPKNGLGCIGYGAHTFTCTNGH